MLHQPVKFLRQWRPRNERKGIDVQPIFSLSLPETNDILQMERRNHDRRFPIGVNQTRIEEFWCAIKPLEKWAGISEIERKRERKRGSFIIRGRFKEPCLSKEGETSKKTGARWMVRRGHCSKGNSVPHYPALFLLEDEEGRRKEAGRFHLARDVRLSHKGATRPLFYALSGFMVYELPRGLAPSILIPVSMGRSTVFLTSLE